MNNERRKRLAALSQQLSELKDEIQAVLDEEEEAFNNLPEGLQSCERGDSMQTLLHWMPPSVRWKKPVTS